MSGFGGVGGFGSAGFGGMTNNTHGGGGGGQGFGGGFGSSAPPQPSHQPPSFGGFGGSPLAPPPAAFGSSPNVVIPPTAFGSAPLQSSGGAFGGTPPSSGFGGGGGFGTATVVQSAPTGTFGTSSSSTTFASGFEKSPLSVGFGSSNTGAFGAAPAAPPIQFGGGMPAAGFSTRDTVAGGSFGSATPSNGFGSAPPTNTFGSAPPSNSFGSAPVSGGFGNVPASGGFGSAPVSGGFGTAPVSGGFGSAPVSGGFGTAPVSGGFGSAPSSSGFGSAPASGGFGSYGSTTPAPASAFGGSSNAVSSGLSSGFGNGALATNTSGFGSSGPNSSGYGSAPALGITFGASSNIMTSSSSIPPPANRFGLPNSGSSWGWKPDTGSSHNNPFGSGPSGMGATNDVDNNDDDGMMDGGAASSTGGFMTGLQRDGRNDLSFRPNYSSSKATSPVPEAGMGDANDELEADDRRKAEADLKVRIEEKKRLLQAKLEEKRRKLLEKQSERTGNSPVPPNDPIVSSRVSKTKNDLQSLAARNALRFGDQPKSLGNAMLPTEMRSKAQTGQQLRVASPETTSTFDQQTATVREDLRTAKALVGTCKFFCPDEELHRREGENDIQQLETPMPGKLHPANWTLRNTVIKRFRRSAADYKLDVPEWVRPPDVLEQVCGYLEEWVMERDRQGPDPRFPQGQTPPPLEVYQFIWDRTRMIRKDFTLQNYVGTGGQCDARAVRCHERIARWHAMCEHQLSHIPDFVTMQSQQNIQELGQTMKTLNQFYDDSLRRATIEVPDEHGKETRSDLSGFAHGCSSNHVQGNPPVEFDGGNLDNSTTNPRISQRILGRHAVNYPSRGTAEPEMRGIYMLLTMNNEGGMEVLKYAAKLFEDRPEIYHSRPVQLSLDIFKAKKELNYARFFSILRDPATPYLFCCIMFKHVELMRKVAFRIMNKSFGGWRKKDGEGVDGVDDTYPLSRLVHLLCFEDLSEARAACEHYGITVKRVPTSRTSDELAEVIYWKGSQFGEPVHPEKKYVIPLPPWKMTRTIERKLDGATRLAVCRGQASGEGATIQPMPAIAVSPYVIHNPAPLSEEEAKAAVLLRQEQVDAVRQVEEQRQRLNDQEEERLAAERKKEEEERLRREEVRKAEEEEKQRALKVQAAKEKEEELKRQKEEERRVAAEMRAQEEARRREQEAAAKRKAEEDYRMAEAERKREEEEAQRVEEAEACRQREQQQRTLDELHRIQEARRQERLRLQAEAERKRIREAEERRQAQEWEDKVNAAKKILIWHRWKNRIARTIETTYGSSICLHRLDPTFGSRSFELQPLYHKGRELPSLDANVGGGGRTVDIRRAIEACNRNVSLRLSLSKMALDEVVSSQPIDESRQALLLKVALLIPHSIDDDCKKMDDLLLSWFNARVGVDKVDSSHLPISGGQHTIRTRSIVHLCRTVDDCFDCDVALIVVPPPWSTNQQQRKNLCSIASILDDSMPRTALVLGDFDDEGYKNMKSFLAETLGPDDGPLKITCNQAVTPEAMESALEAACRSVSSRFVNESCVEIDRRTVAAVASEAVSAYLWGKLSAHDAIDVNVVLECARSAISTLVEETEEVLSVNDEIWSSWPPKDFVSRDGVQGYFSDGSSLPANWRSSLSRENFGQSLSYIRNRLTGSFRDVVESLLFEAPAQIRDDCSLLVAKGFYRRSLQLAMEGFAKYGETSEGRFAYFPRGTLKVILDKLSKITGTFQAESFPSLILPMSDTALVDITPNTNEGILKESWVPMQTNDLLPEFQSTPKRSKRRLSGERHFYESYDFVTSPSGEPKRARGVDVMKSRRDIDESAALTRKMQELVNGGTADLVIGDSFLSRILRGVPMMDTNGGGKYMPSNIRR